MGSFVAYCLWITSGLFGTHHIYLGRDLQAFLWFVTFGCFGMGWIYDFIRIPAYAELADETTGRSIHKARIRSRNGVPSTSIGRLFGQYFFGMWFGHVVSSVWYFGEEENTLPSFIYAVLNVFGTALGIYLVGQVGEQKSLPLKKTTLWCFAGYILNLVLGYSQFHNIVGVYAQHANRKYREPYPAPAKLKKNLFQRFMKLGVMVLVYMTAFSSGLYWHGSVNLSNGEKVYFRDSIPNFLNSDFFQEFNFTEFSFKFQSGEGKHYFADSLDIQGERHALRTLGLQRDATLKEIKTAHRKLALKYHPDKRDKNISEEENEKYDAMIIKINQAYETLNKIHKAKMKKSEKRQEL